MNYTGLMIAVVTFLVIGLFHPLVIWGEYYFSKKIWPVFALAGLVFLALSVNTDSDMASSIYAVVATTCFWSILELFQQEKRVEKGWFPKNPKREKPHTDSE